MLHIYVWWPQLSIKKETKTENICSINYIKIRGSRLFLEIYILCVNIMSDVYVRRRAPVRAVHAHCSPKATRAIVPDGRGMRALSIQHICMKVLVGIGNRTLWHGRICKQKHMCLLETGARFLWEYIICILYYVRVHNWMYWKRVECARTPLIRLVSVCALYSRSFQKQTLATCWLACSYLFVYRCVVCVCVRIQHTKYEQPILLM